MIEGWVIKPVDMESAKNTPPSWTYTAGPKTVYGSCYFHEMQLWASRGFAVLFCNPTGGDGGGDEFADIRGTLRRAGLRGPHALCGYRAGNRCDFIDQERLGVTGGSYGGFMTNWIIGDTDRFKCVPRASGAFLNWISFHNSSDIGWYFAQDQVGGEPWTAWRGSGRSPRSSIATGSRRRRCLSTRTRTTAARSQRASRCFTRRIPWRGEPYVHSRVRITLASPLPEAEEQDELRREITEWMENTSA